MDSSTPRRRAALSASRAADFRKCPLQFRLRTVDMISEPPSAIKERGTLVHAVLEHLYDLCPQDRTPDNAQDMVLLRWEEMVAKTPALNELFTSENEFSTWLSEVRALVAKYFELENPSRLAPAARERFVEVETQGGLLLRGFIDRVDVAPSGAVRVVDYKTGKSPKPAYSAQALFQMRFYALLLARSDHNVPARLQLVYLKDGKILTLDPDGELVTNTESEIMQLWESIEKAAHSQDFKPRKSPLCGWCDFQHLCPLFGGQPPQINEDGLAHLLGARRIA